MNSLTVFGMFIRIGIVFGLFMIDSFLGFVATILIVGITLETKK